MYLVISRLEFSCDDDVKDILEKMAKSRDIPFRDMIAIMSEACGDFLLNEYLDDDLLDDDFPDEDLEASSVVTGIGGDF